MNIKLILLFTLFFRFSGIAQKKDYVVTLKTDFGTTHLLLFDETPFHKQDFVNLVKNKFYDGLLFHRVIKDFMIQGGDPESKNADSNKLLGDGGSNMKNIPFEFTPKHIHQKGALAAARDNNPEKSSSACQFYIVEGKKYNDESLNAIAQKNLMNYTTEQRAKYMIDGGTPFLDNNYTVFGTILDNFDLIGKIASVEKNEANRPIKNIAMTMSVKKCGRKKLANYTDINLNEKNTNFGFERPFGPKAG